MKTLATLAVVTALTLPVGVAAARDDAATAPPLPELLEREPDRFGTLQRLISIVPDVTWFLEGGEPYTLFAPTDDAFAALPDGAVDALARPENHDALRAILEHHVVPDGSYAAADLPDGRTLDPATGADFDVSVSGQTVMVGDATVTRADVRTEQGIVHAVDAVLVPDLVRDALRQRGVLPAE